MNNDRLFVYFSSLPRLFPLPLSGPAFCFVGYPQGVPVVKGTYPTQGTRNYRVPTPSRVPARGTPTIHGFIVLRFRLAEERFLLHWPGPHPRQLCPLHPFRPRERQPRHWLCWHLLRLALLLARRDQDRSLTLP